jgi:hypothetical protein
MNKWTRLATAAGLSVAAVTIGLTSAAAKGILPGGSATPDARAGVHANVTPNATPRPPAHSENTFVSITPCRIVDTRNAVGFIGNGVTRTYYVGGTIGFAPQGGKSGGCGIPVGATAVAATVTAVAPTIGGYLRAYPSNLAEPTATTLNYVAHVSAGTGNTLSLNTGSAQALKVTNHSGRTGLVIDISGYYVPPIEGMIFGTGASLYSGSSRLVSATRNAAGNYTVTVDSNVAYCTPTVTGYSGYVYTSAYAFDGNNIHVYMWTLNASTHAEQAYDGYFYLQVSC